MRSSVDGRKRTVFLKQRHPRERVDPVTRYVSADDLVDVRCDCPDLIVFQAL